MREEGEDGRTATRHLRIECTHIVELLLEGGDIGQMRRYEILKIVTYGISPRRYRFANYLIKMAIGFAARDVAVSLSS